jgi:hypothetical protein
MFMLFGGGGRNFWIIRVGILVLLIGGGAVFHYRGAGYWTIRALYYVVIFSFVLTAVWRNKARRGVGTRGPGSFGQSPYQGGGMQPPFGGQFPSGTHGDSPPSVFPAERPPSVPVADPAGFVPFPQLVPIPVEHSLLSAPGQQPGWYPDPLDPMARHYWDGSTWSHRVTWDGKAWIPA